MAGHGSDSDSNLNPVGTFGYSPAIAGGVNATALRQRLHNLSNAMTGLIGNLELVEMSTEDPEIDMLSLNTALEAARDVMQQVRELKNEVELQISGEAAS